MDYYIGLTCKAHNLVATLGFALKKLCIKEEQLVIRSDKGPQMTSNILREYLKNLEIKVNHEFIPCATPNKDAHVESLYSIIEKEFLLVNIFLNLKKYIKSLMNMLNFIMKLEYTAVLDIEHH